MRRFFLVVDGKSVLACKSSGVDEDAKTVVQDCEREVGVWELEG